MLSGNKIVAFSGVSYVIQTKNGRCICAVSAEHVVDIKLVIARRGPYDGGTGRAADPPEASEVGEPAPKEITMKYNSCARRCVKT